MADSPSPIEETIETSASLAGDQQTLADTDVFQPIDERYVAAERLSSLILFIFAGLGSLAAVFYMWLSRTETVWILIAATGLFLACLLLLWNAIFWPAIAHRHIGWRLSELGLEVRKGVFWKHQTAVPWARAQHADVSQGPLQRMFEIGNLTVHTAGTNNSSVTIEGLAHAQAIQLRDEIIRQRKVHDVV